MTALTDRLDDLMVRLHQEGRDEDAGLILAAIEALTRPALAGTPWTTPRKGDRCTRPDGKSRTVVKALYRRGWMASSTQPDIIEEPAEGYYPDGVRYLDEKGREYYVAASSWATWCRAARKAGGTYDRAPEATT